MQQTTSLRWRPHNGLRPQHPPASLSAGTTSSGRGNPDALTSTRDEPFLAGLQAPNLPPATERRPSPPLPVPHRLSA